jgi:hypothetical protein
MNEKLGVRSLPQKGALKLANVIIYGEPLRKVLLRIFREEQAPPLQGAEFSP